MDNPMVGIRRPSMSTLVTSPGGPGNGWFQPIHKSPFLLANPDTFIGIAPAVFDAICGADTQGRA